MLEAFTKMRITKTPILAVAFTAVLMLAVDRANADPPHGGAVVSADSIPTVTFGKTLPTMYRRFRQRRTAMERRAVRLPWHGRYYDTEYGWPMAQVVPPTANFQTSYSWGVAMTEMNPIYHQYGRAYPGEVIYGGEPFRPMPRWPGHTDQMGYYYLRGPW